MSAEVIVVIGDHRESRELLAETLRAAGLYPVDTATVSEVLEGLLTRHPALLLLDQRSGNSNDEKALSRLRISPSLRNCSIVVVGSAESAEAIDSAFANGADDFVATHRANELLLRVRHQLSRQSVSAEIRRSEFRLADVVHDLNQPLTSVLGYAEVLLRQLGEASPLANAAKMIVSEAERMAAIVRRISRRN